MIYTKWSNPIGWHALAKNCDWFRQITPLSNLTRVSLLVSCFSGNEKLTAKEELNCEIYNSEKNAGKVESVFVIRSAQGVDNLGCCLEYCRSWKIRSENLRLWSTWRPFDSSFERKEALVTVEICVPCGRWFSKKFEIVSETPFSCDAVGRELLWAVVCSLLCRELDWNIGIGKQGYVQCLSDFKKLVLIFAFLNINQCVKNFLPLTKVEFIKWINLINVLFIGFVKQWFSAYPARPILCLVCLARLRTAR